MRRTLSAWLFATVALLPALASAGATVTFPFEDERWLSAGQKNGGAAYVSDRASGEVPLVVFLHGVNESRRLHPRLSDGDDDLRKLVDALVATGRTTPLVLAAPTHSKDATFAETIFPGFDLDAFVEATRAALPSGVRVDRSRVVVIGHSGGACNPTGGLLAAAKRKGGLTPLALVESDGCMDAYVTEALRQAPESTRVLVYWQTWMWPRRFEAFRQLMAPRTGVTLEVITGLTDANAHDRMPELVLARALPSLLAP